MLVVEEGLLPRARAEASEAADVYADTGVSVTVLVVSGGLGGPLGGDQKGEGGGRGDTDQPTEARSLAGNFRRNQPRISGPDFLIFSWGPSRQA